MSGFLRNVFGKGAAAPHATKIAEAPAAISYALASFRWHMDTRPPQKAIALHDYLGSCATWQQLLNECVADLPLSRLTPTEPLEVYCADLRGHNFSEAAPMPSSAPMASAYPLACAADVIKMQEDVLRSEARLVGMGFGSLVASCAALHAPAAFSSLTLFVKDAAELQQCTRSSCQLGDVIRQAPRDAKTLAELNAYLREKVANPVERAALLSAVEVRGGACRFRFNSALLEQTEPLSFEAPANAQFVKPTNVYIYGDNVSCSPEQEAAVRKHFPAAKILKLDTQGAAVAADKLPLVPLFLQSCGLLGEINDAAAG